MGRKLFCPTANSKVKWMMGVRAVLENIDNTHKSVILNLCPFCLFDGKRKALDHFGDMEQAHCYECDTVMKSKIMVPNDHIDEPLPFDFGKPQKENG